jgi:hypothetical protein
MAGLVPRLSGHDGRGKRGGLSASLRKKPGYTHFAV